MNLEADLKAIRNLTRIALPEDEKYVYRLGVVLYAFASVSSFMTEVTCCLDPTLDRTRLQNGTGGTILKKFRISVDKARKSHPAIGPVGEDVADLFEELNLERSDIIHAYPVTNEAGTQILHRRRESMNKYFEVTNAFLDKFISRLHEVSTGLYEIRKLVKPDLQENGHHLN